MPSKGNPVLKLRVDRDLLREIQLAIALRNMWTLGVEWDMSEFLRTAIREKLDKMARSRRKRRRGKNHPAAEPTNP